MGLEGEKRVEEWIGLCCYVQVEWCKFESVRLELEEEVFSKFEKFRWMLRAQLSLLDVNADAESRKQELLNREQVQAWRK